MRQVSYKKKHLRSMADGFHSCNETHRRSFDLDHWLSEEKALPNEFTLASGSLPLLHNHFRTSLVLLLSS